MHRRWWPYSRKGRRRYLGASLGHSQHSFVLLLAVASTEGLKTHTRFVCSTHGCRVLSSGPRVYPAGDTEGSATVWAPDVCVIGLGIRISLPLESWIRVWAVVPQFILGSCSLIPLVSSSRARGRFVTCLRDLNLIKLHFRAGKKSLGGLRTRIALACPASQASLAPALRLITGLKSLP